VEEEQYHEDEFEQKTMDKAGLFQTGVEDNYEDNDFELESDK